MQERKAGLKETQKCHFINMIIFTECLYTKNPWNEKYIKIVQKNHSKPFELRLLIKKRTGYYILAHKCVVLLEKKKNINMSEDNTNSSNRNKGKLLPECINS